MFGEGGWVDREKTLQSVAYISGGQRGRKRERERHEKDGDVAEIRKRDFNCFQGMMVCALLLHVT